MRIKLIELEEVYFNKADWHERLKDWLEDRSPTLERGKWFNDANAERIAESVLDGEASLRMVVNIPPHALIGFLNAGAYQNTYQRAVLMGRNASSVNARRQRVDKLLFNDPTQVYFGALALGGTGVRFYGEYCMVVSEDPQSTMLMDRNSWDIDFEPLSHCNPNDVKDYLTGSWTRDRKPMAKLKVLPQLMERVRLTTSGTVSDALLNDESFVEVHRHCPIRPNDIYEVRESVAGPSIEAQLRYKADQGQYLTPEEVVWLNRRGHVEAELGRHGINTRVIENSGRSR